MQNSGTNSGIAPVEAIPQDQVIGGTVEALNIQIRVTAAVLVANSEHVPESSQ